MEERKFLDFLDMLDGGGAGRSGDKFSGGGLLSGLANAFADPYGSEDKERMAARQRFYASRGIGEPMGSMASRAAPAPAPVQTVSQMATGPNYADRFEVPSAVGPNYADRFEVPSAVAPNYTPMSSMGMPQPSLSFQQFVDGLGSFAATISPEVLRKAYDLHMSNYRP